MKLSLKLVFLKGFKRAISTLKIITHLKYVIPHINVKRVVCNFE